MENVAVAADGAFVVPLHACLASLTAYSSDLLLHILDCGLTLTQRDALRVTVGDKGSLRFIKVPASAFNALPLPDCNSTATYARLHIADLVEAERVLYLDADTLARRPLSQLFATAMNGRAVAAVREMYTPTVGSDNGVRDWPAWGLARDTPYFNAGVMLIDLNTWSNLEVGARALAHLRRRGLATNLFDQEALNVVLAGDWAELPAIWNVTRYWYKPERRFGTHETILHDARIFHYLSEDKPWLPGNNVPEQQTREFFAALDAGALVGWRPPAQ